VVGRDKILPNSIARCRPTVRQQLLFLRLFAAARLGDFEGSLWRVCDVISTSFKSTGERSVINASVY